MPINWKQEDCPELNVGDSLIGITENDTLNHIAGYCGMNPKIDKGLTRKWKVIKVLWFTGSVLVQCGSNVVILDHLNWDDGNRVTLEATLAYSEKKIRWFKEVWR